MLENAILKLRKYGRSIREFYFPINNSRIDKEKGQMKKFPKPKDRMIS